MNKLPAQITEPGRKLVRQLNAAGSKLAAQVAAMAKRKDDDDPSASAGVAVPRPTKPPSDKARAFAEVPA